MSLLPVQINELSIAEKFELLDALWQNIEAQAPTLSDEQSAELDQRITAYERDPSAVIPWEKIKARSISR